MNFTNVKLILVREIRDQLRDRRTLFMIAILPLLLYPLLGISFSQMLQFLQHRTRVLVIGSSDLNDFAPLIEEDNQGFHFAEDLDKARLLEVTLIKPDDTVADEGDHLERMKDLMSDQYEVVVYFPPDFVDQMKQFRKDLIDRKISPDDKIETSLPKIPSPKIYKNSSKNKSEMTYDRVYVVLSRWIDKIGKQNLKDSKVPASAARPFELETQDVADEAHKGAALWSKILPFILLMWALTGAFYPAVDLCAGEKERGTLETLLSSPAERSEIVMGKLFTIMIFSMATALLNLISLGITGLLLHPYLPQIGPPPLLSIVWLVIALVPLSALFSALCLALAAFARSTKEGQYYLVPLVMIMMPLMVLPMAPGVEITLGYSLIPVTGAVLLLQTMIEGHYSEALRYIVPVVGVTLVCCYCAIRWAIDLFNSESVLFRESEQFNVGLWLKQMRRERRATPTVAAALMCALLILVVNFLLRPLLPQPDVDATAEVFMNQFTVLAVLLMLLSIVLPTILMTVMLTRSSKKTLLLSKPPLLAIPAAILLAVCLHPTIARLSQAVQQLYPVSEHVTKSLKNFENALGQSDNLWQLLFVVALLPAVCEELAFRGFILSGFRRLGHKRQAIILSAIFFGMTHGIIQQSMIACLSGVILGYIAVQTGSLLPCILYHFSNNSLAILSGHLVDKPYFGWLVKEVDGQLVYPYWIVGVGAFCAAGLLWWFHCLPYEKPEEEKLAEAIERESASAASA